jgi:hypothetical protein
MKKPVRSALRFMLEVSAGPPDQGYFTCISDHRGGDSHHAMCCDKISGFLTLHHNHVQNTVPYRCTVRHFDTYLEPKEKGLKDLKFGDVGYGKREEILLST